MADPEVGQVGHELRRVPEREAGVELHPVRRARRSAGRGSFSHHLQDALIELDDEISRFGLGQEVFSGGCSGRTPRATGTIRYGGGMSPNPRHREQGLQAMALYSSLDEMAAAAIEVLRRNDLGGWTKAAPRLYPHQWSWDSAFIAIGLAHVDTARAAQELREPLRGAVGDRAACRTSSSTRMCRPTAISRTPNAGTCANLSADVPAGKLTSGLIQPPVHAIAAWRILEVAERRSAADRSDGGCLPARDLPEAVRLAPLPADRARPGSIRPGHDLPPLGERTRQLATLGCGAGADRGRRAGAVHPIRSATRRRMPRSARPTRSTTAISGWSSCSSRLVTTTQRSWLPDIRSWSRTS